MELDFLTPGTWQDSYESRVCNPFHQDIQGRDSYEVNTLGDIISVARNFIQINQHYFELFPYTDIYIEGHLLGELRSNGQLTIYAPSRVNFKNMTIYYPYGKENKTLQI